MQLHLHVIDNLETLICIRSISIEWRKNPEETPKHGENMHTLHTQGRRTQEIKLYFALSHLR